MNQFTRYPISNTLNKTPKWYPMVNKPMLYKLNCKVCPDFYYDSEDAFGLHNATFNVGGKIQWTAEKNVCLGKYKLTGVFVSPDDAKCFIKYDVLFLINNLKISEKTTLTVNNLFNSFPTIIPCVIILNNFLLSDNRDGYMHDKTLMLFNKEAVKFLTNNKNPLDLFNVFSMPSPFKSFYSFNPGYMFEEMFSFEDIMEYATLTISFVNVSGVNVRLYDNFIQYMNHIKNMILVTTDSNLLRFFKYTVNYINVNGMYMDNSLDFDNKTVKKIVPYEMFLFDYLRSRYFDFMYFYLKNCIVKNAMCKYACNEFSDNIVINEIHDINLHEISFIIEQTFLNLSSEEQIFSNENFYTNEMEIFKTFDEEIILTNYCKDKMMVSVYDGFLLFLNSHSIFNNAVF